MSVGDFTVYEWMLLFGVRGISDNVDLFFFHKNAVITGVDQAP